MVDSDTKNLERLLEKIAAHFKISSAGLQIETIRHGTRERQNVCRLKIGTEHYVLKQHEVISPAVKTGNYTPFQIESTVLSTLHRSGCYVPKIVWEFEPLQSLLLECGGEFTLDAIAQRQANLTASSMKNNECRSGDSTETRIHPVRPSSDVPICPTLDSIVQIVLRELCRIERCFVEYSAYLKPYIFPFNSHDNLKRLLERGKRTVGYLTQIRGVQMSAPETARFETAWNAFSSRLLDVPTTLGSLDYNARNIVIGSGKPLFIDFASIGWDWRERRLNQMLNSLGAFVRGANFVSLLNRKFVKTYAEYVIMHSESVLNKPEEIGARVDAHHLLFYLSIVHRLLKAVARPKAPESHILLNAWGEPQARFQRALELIATTHLSDDVHTQQIRDIIAEFCIYDGKSRLR